MAIYTMQNYSMLSAKPLDAKRIMTYNQWDADDMGGLSYPGQLYYDPETGWFRIYGNYIDNTGIGGESEIFGLGIDGIYIGSDVLYMTYGAAEISMLGKANHDPDIYMQSEADASTTYTATRIDYSGGPNSNTRINFLGQDIVFGASNDISNNNNKVISIIGTGLTANNPTVNQFIIGKYNESNPAPSFIIGNGTDNTHRGNVLEVYNDDIDLYGDLNMTYNKLYAEEILPFYLMDYNIALGVSNSDLFYRNTRDFYGPGTYITQLRLKIFRVFDSTAKLNIFTVSDTRSTTPVNYIIQDYPIGQMSAGDIAIEELFCHSTDIIDTDSRYIACSVTGDTTHTGEVDMLLKYCVSW